MERTILRAFKMNNLCRIIISLLVSVDLFFCFYASFLDKVMSILILFQSATFPRTVER